MKKLLIASLVLCSLAASAQPTNVTGFTKINARYYWLEGMFKYLRLPVGVAADTTDKKGYAPTLAGNIMLDSVTGNVWVKSTYWRAVGADAGLIGGNLGSAYRLYSPGSKGVKTVDIGRGLSGDSATSNQIAFSLGQAIGASGNPALISTDREIPFNSDSRYFKFKSGSNEVRIIPAGAFRTYNPLGGGLDIFFNPTGADRAFPGVSYWRGTQAASGGGATLLVSTGVDLGPSTNHYFIDVKTGEIKSMNFEFAGAASMSLKNNGDTYIGILGTKRTSFGHLYPRAQIDNNGTTRLYDTTYLGKVGLLTSGSGYDIVLRNRTDSALYRIPFDSLSTGGGGGSTSLPSGEVGYGTGSGITSSPAFVYGTGQLAVGAVGTQGYYKLFGGTSGAVRITTAAAAGTWDLTLPTDDGTNGQVLTTDGSGVTSWQTVSGGSPLLSSILAASAANTIDNTNYKQKFNWSTLGGDTAMIFRAHTTGASSNAQVLGASILTGANATSSQTTIAWAFQNAKTGTSATNIAADFTASGGTTNIAGRFSAESNNIQLTNSNKGQNTGVIERNSSGGLTVRGDIDGLWLRSGGSATSGIEVNTLAASAPIILKTNNVERVRVTNAGLALYQPSTTTAPDSALYLEDGVVKATLVSGTYTPTASAASGITVGTVEPFVWSRSGSVVTVSGYIGTTGATAGTPASFELTLPVASNLTTVYQCTGTVGSVVAGSDGYILGEATNNTAVIQWVGGATAGSQGLRVMFQYQVL